MKLLYRGFNNNLEEWIAVETKVVVVARVRVSEIAIGVGTDKRLLATGYVGFSVASADIRIEDVSRWADLYQCNSIRHFKITDVRNNSYI